MDRRKKTHLFITATFVAIGLVATIGIIAVALRTVRSDGSARGIGGGQTGGGPPSWMIAGMEGDPAARAETARAIGSRKALNGLPVLEKGAATDPDPKVKIACLQGLGELARPEPVPAICVLAGHEHAGVRAAAAEALGKIEHRLAVPALFRTAKDQAVEVRRATALALASKKHDEVSETLLGMSSDRRAEVRMAAVESATKRGDDICIRVLAGRAVLDNNDGVRVAAAVALRRIGARAAPDLYRALPGSKSPEGRQLGVNLAVALDGTNAVAGLIAAVENAQAVSSLVGNDLSDKVAEALATLGPKGVPVLSRAVSAPGRTMFGRETAEAAIKRINP